MLKVKTTADTYKSVVLRRAILICWVLLFVCFAIKIFGGNYFAIIVNKPKFVEFCQFLDSNIILYGLIGLISSLISYALFYLALLRQLWFNKKQFWVFISSVLVFCVLRIMLEYLGLWNWITVIINIFQCFLMPFILGMNISKKNVLICILGNILNLSFQIIASITKSIGIKFITENSLQILIFTIDVYIMLALYYLYSNNIKKGEKK